jgi:hypothetical protein
MIEASTKILLDVLARVNAVFTPIRRQDRRTETAVQELQREYRASGIPFRLSGGDTAERKENERTLAELAGAGLVKLSTGDVRRSRVWLSDAADEKLRAMVGLSGGVAKTIAVMSAVADAEVRGWGYGAERSPWIPEVYLTGLDWRDPAMRPQVENRIFLLEDFALFGLVRGWLDTFYDTQPKTYYRVTPEGHQVWQHVPELSADVGRFDSKAAAYYDDHYPEAEAWLDTIRPRHENEVVIPFSAGLGARAYDERLPADHPLIELFQRIENPVSPKRRNPKCQGTR